MHKLAEWTMSPVQKINYIVLAQAWTHGTLALRYCLRGMGPESSDRRLREDDGG